MSWCVNLKGVATHAKRERGGLKTVMRQKDKQISLPGGEAFGHSILRSVMMMMTMTMTTTAAAAAAVSS